jgi:hypothetical protein
MAVFVSHHSSRQEVAEHLVGYLERHGVDCWLAPRNIRGGDSWD